MLRCFNTICIYQRDDYCNRSYIEINSTGMCEDAESVYLPPEMLKALKREAFEKDYPWDQDSPDDL